MNSWTKQVSSLLILQVWDYLIGILRKGCLVFPWCVVSVIPATVMYKKQKN